MTKLLISDVTIFEATGMPSTILRDLMSIYGIENKVTSESDSTIVLVNPEELDYLLEAYWDYYPGRRMGDVERVSEDFSID
jgi:hypothetical protein